MSVQGESAGPFVAPASVRDAGEDVCSATLDGRIRCEMGAHEGHQHRNGPLVWHEPPLILVDGQEPDLTVESERWRGGRVLLAADVEPDLGPVFDPYDIPYR